MASPKPRRERTESAPSSRSASVSKSNRKARRAKEREEKAKAQEEARAGASTPLAEAGPGPSTTAKAQEAQEAQDAASNSFADQDFIAFTFSDGEDEQEEKKDVEEEAFPVREWDKGKTRARDHESAGRKRRHDEIDYNDGYANKKQRTDAASRRAPWAVDVDWDRCNNVADMLHQEVDAFVKYISPTPIEDEVRGLIITAVSRAVTQAFPDAKVLPFGSYETKLYLPLGDIDLVIESPSMAYSNKTNVLQALASTVKRAGITDKVTIIAKAKVPIIKFITRHGRFSVDVSINQMNGVKAGKMVKRFIDHLPALRALVLITKSFLSQRSMNEVFTGGLGSYSIVCLAISFLQQHPKIRRGEIDPSKNLGVLVMEFFELYGCYFNYTEVGISVRDGGSYYNKAQRGWSDYKSPGLLSIEDPGDPNNDISRGSYGIGKVRQTLAGAYNIMTAAAYIHQQDITARKEGRRVQLMSRRDPEAMSILASVMGVTQETINHRRLVEEVYEKRTLHRLLGVDPQANVISVSADVPKTDTGSKRKRAAEESVQSAWEHDDAEPDSPRKREAEPEEEESRYGIDKRQPPTKRRRMGTQMDAHTVYTTDEDDEDEDEDDDEDGNGDGDEPEEGELLVHTVGDSDSETARHEDEYDTSIAETKESRAERRRSYWLSKSGGGIDLED